MSREFLMAGPLEDTLTTDNDETSKIVASEPGVLHLGRLLFFAGIDIDLVGYSDLDLSMGIQISSLQYNGAEQLIRGRNTPAPPASVFSPYRLGRVVDLGDYSFATGDTLAATVQAQGSNVAGNFAMCAPFSPRNQRSGYIGPVPKGRISYAGSPTSQVAAGASTDLSLTADADGILDLSSMAIRAMLDQAATGEYGPSTLATTVITQITLPSGDNLILGQSQGGVAGSIFRADRAGNWVDFGKEWVAAGSVVKVSVTNTGADIANFSWGCPFVPADGESPC